jgi:trans-aconitate 2-methyltransferase
VPWDPERYEQFRKERYAPFEDLLGLLEVRSGLQVVDLGCGTGELTERLAEHLPESDVLGIDASEEMLERATPLTRDGLRFELGAIESTGGKWDLVFSNAAIQWVDDHDALIPKLMSLVTDGGRLVVQLPSNQGHPTHTLLRDIAADPEFSGALGGWNRKFPVLSVEQYAESLHAHGGSRITIFEKVYPHILPDADALVDWMSGTAMVPYMDRLSISLQNNFVARYRESLFRLWPGGPIFFGFKRILFAVTVHDKAVRI